MLIFDSDEELRRELKAEIGRVISEALKALPAGKFVTVGLSGFELQLFRFRILTSFGEIN